MKNRPTEHVCLMTTGKDTGETARFGQQVMSRVLPEITSPVR
ncbi:hypothetical protein [Yersinia nurmii]